MTKVSEVLTDEQLTDIANYGVPDGVDPVVALRDLAITELERRAAMKEPVAWRYCHELPPFGNDKWDSWQLAHNEPIERSKKFIIQYEPLYALHQSKVSPEK